MHLYTLPSFPSAPYPSPPSTSPADEYLPPSDDDGTMSNNKGTANVDGVGTLTYQRAIDIARNTEGDLDPTVSNYLEGAITDIWTRINASQGTYVLSRDEFAVFNYYIRRFEGSPVAEQAIDRYWRATSENNPARQR